MNNFDFTQPGGFPLDQEVLGLLQDNTKLAANSALLGGEFFILTGCTVVGGNASNGVVVIGSEVLPFVGGVITAKVIIVETVTNLLFEDGANKGVEKIRYATFGDDGITNYLWASFERNVPTNALLKRVRLLEEHSHIWSDITGKPPGFITYVSGETLGDIAGQVLGGPDALFTIIIPDQGDTNYIVAGSLVGLQLDSTYDNDVSWVITSKTAASFKISVREYNAVIQNLRFEFAIIKTA
ncbi:MAG: hypothetical protein Q8K66_13070 [Sediminibacterium sp.]|nr:hypothetical protein [Sediminibacterium sp.]MDP3128834.1 hypothetical protein [Sediminibacterium sp.]